MTQPLVGIEIVERIADLEGVDPVDLDTPLNDVIDPDALEALTNGTGDRQSPTNLRVRFSYAGYAITVAGGGTVSIDERPTETKTAESGGEATDDSRVDIHGDRDHRESTLRRAAEIIGDSKRSFTEQVSAVLEVVREAVGTDYATLSHVDNDAYHFEAVDMPSDVRIQAGQTVPLAEHPGCKEVVETGSALVLRDVEVEAPDLADHIWGISSYIGVPVFVDGEIYGTFCFFDVEARSEAFSDWDLAVVELLGTWVAGELEQRKQQRALDAHSMERPVSAE